MLRLLLRRLAICKETGIILILLKRESKVNCKLVSGLRHFLSLFPLVLMITFSGGCAGLPPASEAIHDVLSTHEAPEVFSAEGPLSPDKSKALIEQLKSSVAPTDFLERHIAVMEFLGGSPLIKGNKVKLLVDGPATYNAMFRAIQNARNHINIETFIIEDDEAGHKLADLLVRKRARGVQVNLIYDSYGSSGTPDSFFQRLRDNRINVVAFNPMNPLNIIGKRRVTYRDHRKILIVDGSLAITGGVNFSKVYSSRPSGGEREEKAQLPWRDTDVQIEGPAVAEFQKLFLDTWEKQKGTTLKKRKFFPHLKEKGTDLVQVIGSVSAEENRTTFIMYVSAISFAANSIHLTNAYFAPDEQTIRALIDAARRGIDVRIIVPGTSDIPLALYAGQYYYSDLLDAGVKLYQRRNVILHAKTAVIDGVWSTVGSTNMDFWSFAVNDEVNAIILGSEFARKMEELFAKDVAESDQIQKEQWEKRPLDSRMREFLAHLLARLL